MKNEATNARENTMNALTIKVTDDAAEIRFEGGNHGSHSLWINATDDMRVAAHAAGYAENNGATDEEAAAFADRAVRVFLAATDAEEAEALAEEAEDDGDEQFLADLRRSNLWAAARDAADHADMVAYNEREECDECGESEDLMKLVTGETLCVDCAGDRYE